MIDPKDKSRKPGMVREYGLPPYGVAVLHGGPGAPGYMALVARELGKTTGILEPLQSKDSLEGQIEELKSQLSDYAEPPITLIGSSWGAVLALFLAARNEIDIKKLILIGSAVFDAESSASIEVRRLERLDTEKRQRLETIQSELETATGNRKDDLAEEWGDTFFNTDVYDPVTRDLEAIEMQFELHKKVWSDFVALRDRPGFLKSEFSKIDLPVVVIHGEYDPHPIIGIRPFLESCLTDVKFHMLPKCGHYPWIERHAKGSFYDILRNEI